MGLLTKPNTYKGVRKAILTNNSDMYYEMDITGYRPQKKVPTDSTLGSKNSATIQFSPFGLQFQVGVRKMITPVWNPIWYDLIIEKVPEPYTRLLKHLKGTDYLGLMGGIYTDS